jgi:hypothetical protein
VRDSIQQAWAAWAQLQDRYLAGNCGPQAVPTLLSEALAAFKDDMAAVRWCTVARASGLLLLASARPPAPPPPPLTCGCGGGTVRLGYPTVEADQGGERGSGETCGVPPVPGAPQICSSLDSTSAADSQRLKEDLLAKQRAAQGLQDRLNQLEASLDEDRRALAAARASLAERGSEVASLEAKVTTTGCPSPPMPPPILPRSAARVAPLFSSRFTSRCWCGYLVPHTPGGFPDERARRRAPCR